MESVNVFEFSAAMTALELVRNNVTDSDSLLSFKQAEIQQKLQTRIRNGERGVHVTVSHWKEAPPRADWHYCWPLDEEASKGTPCAQEDYTWTQEYRWVWGQRYETRNYWCPSSFIFPSVIAIPQSEQMEKVIGPLGVNISQFDYCHIYAIPRRRGYRPVNPAIELIFIQEYEKDWEELTLLRHRWETRWAVELNTVWLGC
ncbi:uncharacterized protein LOC122510647 [Leptopilina heterotoma]|uniref:uncharacterized protein LOC122499069 n=1 Tax=Leptopilina heterotoma TaxID=63436 RepID=UPI001CA954A8|nr:uncharacterized protein LOC122499069 [Leptopilina heterotoma]XP_043464090.1 uncharacterized protein LOC122499681 [Leptopilina heterotoma]XP_043467528.1 uncharacterized protein LOC122501831 [Leptopilina heterotoma]XP_043471703.1 uncharacterized protein LOC122504591 [Leptopilina heterotoma]XP_043479948.1 uncharacterized protein LOC122509774 [Leptopilina heterotoma]XP_043481358.1 uncharacterized protein LOC122510647 [Leptopilina heterotoma]